MSSLPTTSQNTTWSWNAGTSTGTFGWTGTSYNSTELFSAGDYSAYATLNLKTAAGTADHFRILVDFSNGTGQLAINPVAAGNVSITLTDYITLANLACVSSIRLSGANDVTGNITVSRVYLEGPDYIKQTTVKAAPDGVTNINGLEGAGNYTWNVSYPIAIGESTQVGGDIDSDNQSVDLTGFDYIVFVVSEVSNGAKVYLRTFVASQAYEEGEQNKNKYRKALFPHPIAEYSTVENWEEEAYISAPGVYVVKVNISENSLLRGIKNKAYWQGSSGTAKISLAYIGSGSTPAAPVDQIARVGEGALTDASATWFDVTGLTESGITYNATNSNALFVTNDDDELTNTNNVIVSGTCDNLVLTDGNFPFKAYDSFTATNASYDRSFKAGARSTLCLPFALTAEEAAAAGKFYELSGVNAAGTELTFTEVTASGTTAYKPYIFEATADGTPFSTYSSKSIAATPNSLAFTGTTVEGYTLTGVLTGSSDVAADHAGKTVYGWSANSDQEGTFVKVGTGVSINPFRAYVVYDGGSGSSAARMAVRFDGDDVTGINECSESQSLRNAIGKFVENGKIVIFKNGMKFNANGQQIK